MSHGYIIAKLNVKELRMEIIYASDSENSCKAQLLGFIQNNEHINKVVENDYIKSYKINEGYIYNQKTLECIYQILKVEPDYDSDE